MYFKFTILLLSFIITANCVLENPEDEDPSLVEIENKALKDAYEFALLQFKVTPRKGLSSKDMTTFLGSNNLEVKNYLTEKNVSLENQENIDLTTFMELVRLVCKRYKYVVTDFIDKRETTIASP